MTITTTRHEYIPQMVLFGEGVVAHCSCGWRSAYTHAFNKYAHEDWEHHIQTEREKNVQG